jgi:type II secretory pathway pseudopilin PulG
VLQYVFAALILLVNIVAIVFLLYQSYHARNLPTEFNEGFFVTLTTFSLLESLLLAGPLLFLVYDNPSADFMIKSIIVTISCLAILLPLFIPKYLQRNIRALRKNSQQESGGGRRSSVARMTMSGDRFSQFSPPIREDPIEARVVAGQSTIKRSKDYYLQRGSMPDITRRHRSMSAISTPKRHHDSLPTVSQSPVLASRTDTTTKTGCRFNKESKALPIRSSDSNGKPGARKSVSISALDSFEPVEPEFLAKLNAIQESLSPQKESLTEVSLEDYGVAS